MAAVLERFFVRIPANILKENSLARLCRYFAYHKASYNRGKSSRKVFQLLSRAKPVLRGRLVPPLLAAFGFFSSSVSKDEPAGKTDSIAPQNELSNVQKAVMEADKLYHNRAIEELYKFLMNYKESDSAELLWRLARAAREFSQETSDKEKKKQLTYDALDYAKKALELDDKNFACHKWYAISLSNVGDYEGSKTKIKNAYVMKEHFQKAIDLNPGDPTSRHLLGVWCFTFADMPWYQHKLAAAIFSTPPTSTYEEALSYFEMAESLEANFYCENLKMLGKTYLRMGNKEKARHWLQKAVNYDCKTLDDKQAKKEAEELIKQV